MVLDQRCNFITNIVITLKCDKNRAGTLRSCFDVRLACEVWLVRAWNHSALYTSAPTKCSQQAALHSLTLLAHTYSATHNSPSSYCPAPICCQTGVIYWLIYFKKVSSQSYIDTDIVFILDSRVNRVFVLTVTQFVELQVQFIICNLLMGLYFVQTVANVFQSGSVCQTKLQLITLRVAAFHSATSVPESCYCACRLTGMAYWGT